MNDSIDTREQTNPLAVSNTAAHLIAVDVVVGDESLDGADGLDDALAGHLAQQPLVLAAVAQEQVHALRQRQLDLCREQQHSYLVRPKY